MADSYAQGAARVVETLARTGLPRYFLIPSHGLNLSTRRLFYQSSKTPIIVRRNSLLTDCAITNKGSETTQHILQCTQSLESVQPGGAGHASSIRVRLLHAAVRQRILKLARQRHEYYEVNTWGIPINDLDCIATISSFCATLIWISLPRQGILMTQREITDYVALWRYVAYLMGTPTEHFETPEKAKRIMEAIMLYEIKPTETSKILSNNVIKSLAGQPPGFASEAFIQANSRWLNGDELSDALGIGRPGIYYRALTFGQCLFFMAICYTYRAVPYLDRRKIAVRSLCKRRILAEQDG